ncbi:gamma-glutamyl-gamma-aminobutyrate hydrolase family protein [Thermoleophilia bacterium SCSIO 60948]|nr:gamma-glutamyl-gamma-aminobutyrate hydrolase family protein [Thermoleophilia bacterium SCSIO 60948]
MSSIANALAKLSDRSYDRAMGAEQDAGDRPLIGVTTSEVRIAKQVEQTRWGEPPRREMSLGLNYLQAIEDAGGLPVVLPPLGEEAIGPMLGRLDAVCLSGGPDIHPVAYGRPEHPALGPTWRDIDIAELALADLAYGRGLPILAICRGAQALNVVRGGTLFQHVPERFGDRVQHRQAEIGPRTAHPVTIDPESRLSAALGTTETEVNSFHHQSIDTLGDELQAVAFADDGVIEGIESVTRDFVIGVQWHAETLSEDRPQARLFEALVEVARLRSLERAEVG